MTSPTKPPAEEAERLALAVECDDIVKHGRHPMLSDEQWQMIAAALRSTSLRPGQAEAVRSLSDFSEVELHDEIHRRAMQFYRSKTEGVSVPATAQTRQPADGVVALIDMRLEDLAEANALYGKDQRLGAPDKIARNDREISWLKDFKSQLRAAPTGAVAGEAVAWRETIQTLLDLLNPLHGELDRQTYDEKVKADFDLPRDAEHNVNITQQMESDLTQAVCILENRLAALPANPPVDERAKVVPRQAGCPMKPLEPLLPGETRSEYLDRLEQEEAVTPAVRRAKDFFWEKADEYDHEKLLSIYNDMHDLQDRVETIPLSQALDAMDLALQLIDRLTTKGD